jgi:hypothetical protein
MTKNYQIEHTQENIEKTKHHIQELERQEARLLASCKEEERKLRTRRLIKRGAFAFVIYHHWCLISDANCMLIRCL